MRFQRSVRPTLLSVSVAPMTATDFGWKIPRREPRVPRSTSWARSVFWMLWSRSDTLPPWLPRYADLACDGHSLAMETTDYQQEAFPASKRARLLLSRSLRLRCMRSDRGGSHNGSIQTCSRPERLWRILA